MKNLVCFLLLLTGCSESAELSAMKAALEITGEKVVAKQDQSLTILRDNTTALAAIKSQVESMEAFLSSADLNRKDGDPAANEPQETQQNSRNTSLSVADSPAVRLFVTHASFHCAPCERLKKAVENGEFAGFEVITSEDFQGIRSYPAIRFETPTTQTGWGVVYGYDQNTIPTLRALTQGTGAPATGAIFPVSRQSAVINPRTSFRPAARWFGYNRGQRVKTRKSCPASGCPRG